MNGHMVVHTVGDLRALDAGVHYALHTARHGLVRTADVQAFAADDNVAMYLPADVLVPARTTPVQVPPEVVNSLLFEYEHNKAFGVREFTSGINAYLAKGGAS